MFSITIYEKFIKILRLLFKVKPDYNSIDENTCDGLFGIYRFSCTNPHGEHLSRDDRGLHR